MGVTKVVALVIPRGYRIALDGAREAGRYHLPDVHLARAVTPDCEKATALNVADEPFVSVPASTMFNPCQRECLSRHRRYPQCGELVDSSPPTSARQSARPATKA